MFEVWFGHSVYILQSITYNSLDSTHTRLNNIIPWLLHSIITYDVRYTYTYPFTSTKTGDINKFLIYFILIQLACKFIADPTKIN